jgi:hypothetical protein
MLWKCGFEIEEFIETKIGHEYWSTYNMSILNNKKIMLEIRPNYERQRFTNRRNVVALLNVLITKPVL